MDDLVAYISRLEVMAFFSGYPLIYAIVQAIGSTKSSVIIKELPRFLSVSYFLTGVLFLGFILKGMYPDYSSELIMERFFRSFLHIWALLSLVFWIPFFRRRPIISLLHSLIFFFLLLKDLFNHAMGSTGKEMIKNDMKIYSDSLLINITTFILASGAGILICYVKKKNKHISN